MVTWLPAGAPIRGEVRRVGFRRISHGLHLPLLDGEEQGSDEAWLRELEAWQLVLPADAVFTHLTGARLRRWQLPRLPDDLPVFAASRSTKRPRRPGLVCARLRRPSATDTRQGKPVDSAEETLLRCARDLGVLDLVILMDSALRCRDLEPADLEALLASRRPGVRRLRAAYRYAHPKAESAGESVLRVFHEVCDIGATPQRKLYDPQGNLIAQVDLLLDGTTFVSEYDGEHHRQKRQHRTDLRRDRLFNGTVYTRNAYTLDDLLNQPTSTLHELDRMLGRDHDLSRLRRWRRLVEHSMYTPATRTRMMNRWRRLSGVVEWPGTA
jgi:hypothetical protein